MARIHYTLGTSVLFLLSLAIKPSIQQSFEDPDFRDDRLKVQPNATSSNTFLGPSFMQDKEKRFLWNVTTRVQAQTLPQGSGYATFLYIDFDDDAPLSGPEVNRTVLGFGFKGVGPRKLNHSDSYNGCGFIPQNCRNTVLDLLDQSTRTYDNGTLEPHKWGPETRKLITEICEGALKADPSGLHTDDVNPYSTVQLFPAMTKYDIGRLQGRFLLSEDYYLEKEGRSLEAAYDEAVNTPLFWVFYSGPSMTPDAPLEGFWQDLIYFCVKPDYALPGSRAIGSASGLQTPTVVVLLLVGLLVTVSQAWL